MTDQTTEFVPEATEVIDVESEPVESPSALAKAAAGAALAVSGTMDEQKTLAALAAHGMIVPLAAPSVLRKIYGLRQKMYAAILDENDYLWIVKYQDGNNGRQYIARNKAHAEERAEALQGEVSGKPIKNGVQKLAEALGITTRCVRREERSYFGRKGVYCEYEAKHEQTGKVEEGVGFCGIDEKRGKISVHDMVTTADTRAYNRAVLRLCAFGDISAEELVAGVGTAELPEFVPEATQNIAVDPLPEESSDDVLGAFRAYHEAVMGRDATNRFAPEAKQGTLSARVARALARRGDQKSAKKLGKIGLKWSGVAQDSPAHQTFDVPPPPQAWLDAVRPAPPAPETSSEEKPDKLAAALGKPEEPPAAAQNGKGEDKEGWDLNGEKGKKDDEGLPADLPERHETKNETTAKSATEGIPQPDLSTDSITVAQAKKISRLMVEVLGSKEAAREWLKAESYVDKSVHVRRNQYDAITRALDKKKEK